MLTLARRPQHAGFSLVELLVVIAILGIVGAVTVTSLVRGFDNSELARSRLDALAEGQRGVANAARELRSACPLVALDSANNRAVLTIRDRTAVGSVDHYLLELIDGGRTLVRQEVDAPSFAATDVGGPFVLARGLTPTPSTTVLQMRGTNPSTGTYGDVSDPVLAEEVRIRLELPTDNGVEPFETTVQLRNRGATGC